MQGKHQGGGAVRSGGTRKATTQQQPASNGAGASTASRDRAIDDEEGGPVLSDKWKELLSRIPKKVEIFADASGDGSDVRGILYAHELLLGYPTKPPACVEVMVQTRNGYEPQRMTPSAAETLSGRGSRKSWKETLKTWDNGRAITLKTYFALHGV